MDVVAALVARGAEVGVEAKDELGSRYLIISVCDFTDHMSTDYALVEGLHMFRSILFRVAISMHASTDTQES